MAYIHTYIHTLSLYRYKDKDKDKVCYVEKRRDIRNFYVDENFIPVYEKFKKIVETENVSISDKIRELITEYTRLHEPGNPQQRLDTIMRIGHAYRAESCCVCAKTADVQAFTETGLTLLYCAECFEKTGRKKTIGHGEYKKKKDERCDFLKYTT